VRRGSCKAPPGAPGAARREAAKSLGGMLIAFCPTPLDGSSCTAAEDSERVLANETPLELGAALRSAPERGRHDARIGISEAMHERSESALLQLSSRASPTCGRRRRPGVANHTQRTGSAGAGPARLRGPDPVALGRACRLGRSGSRRTGSRGRSRLGTALPSEPGQQRRCTHAAASRPAHPV
jgi:hypothetical protein